MYGCVWGAGFGTVHGLQTNPLPPWSSSLCFYVYVCVCACVCVCGCVGVCMCVYLRMCVSPATIEAIEAIEPEPEDGEGNCPVSVCVCVLPIKSGLHSDCGRLVSANGGAASGSH